MTDLFLSSNKEATLSPAWNWFKKFDSVRWWIRRHENDTVISAAAFPACSNTAAYQPAVCVCVCLCVCVYVWRDGRRQMACHPVLLSSPAQGADMFPPLSSFQQDALTREVPGDEHGGQNGALRRRGGRRGWGEWKTRTSSHQSDRNITCQSHVWERIPITVTRKSRRQPSDSFNKSLLSVCLSIFLSVCVSVYLSIYLSVYPSVCLSVCLSYCIPLHKTAGNSL